jgi:hypothetical protein
MLERGQILELDESVLEPGIVHHELYIFGHVASPLQALFFFYVQ